MSSITSDSGSQRTLSPPPPRSPSPPVSTGELSAYKPLFRRRKPPVSEPPVPCLSCALADMHCVYYRGEARCQRCERNGGEDAVCIFQRQDITRPEARLTARELEQLEEEARLAERRRGPRHAWLTAHHQDRYSQQDQLDQQDQQPELQCMVYSRDPELARDRALLLSLAAGMLAAAEHKGTTWVHGIPVGAADARNLVLPNWQEASSWREKRDSSPEYRRRAAFFEGLTAEQAAATARARALSRERRMAREESADKRRRERERGDKGKAAAEAGPEQDEY